MTCWRGISADSIRVKRKGNKLPIGLQERIESLATAIRVGGMAAAVKGLKVAISR